MRKLLIFGLAAMLAAVTARAEPTMLPAWPERPLLGPGTAKGAVIWSHGLARLAEASGSPNPVYIEALVKAGWDVYRVNRKWSEDRVYESAPVLATRAEQLRAEGYNRIVLAGQSFGGWLSFAAAARSAKVDAIVATAPAAHGQRGESATWELNATNLYELLGAMNRARVMLFLFAGDPYDPGGRGKRAAAILKERGFEHVIVDAPEGFHGHGVADSAGFARRFGACIASFIAGDSATSECAEPPVRLAELGIPLPKGFSVAKPGAGVPATLKHYAGTWYGYYGNGRELVFAPTSFSADGVRAVYSYGRTAASVTAVGTTHRSGNINGGALVFNEDGRPRLTYRPRPDGRLDATWEATDRTTTLKGVLKRID